MGTKNSKQDKLNSFMSQYDIIQQIQTQNLTFLQHKRTNQQFLLREFSFNDRKQFDKTISNFSPLKNKLQGCKHVVPLKDYLTTSEDQYCSTFYKIYALFEYPQRTLDDEVSERNLQKRKFAETQLWSILASCILGLSHLQKNGIKHSALKSRNILLSKEGIIKVSDPFATGQHANYQTALTKRTSPHLYLPPEQTNALQQQLISPSLNTYKGDIWTMGMIMLQAGLLQYQDQCYRDQWSRVHWQTLHYNINRFGQTYSEQLKNMLQFMLSKEQKMRPDWIELEEHVMKNNEENRNSLLQNQTPKVENQMLSQSQTPKVQTQNDYNPPILNSKPTESSSARKNIITDRYNNSPSKVSKYMKSTNNDIPLTTKLPTGVTTNVNLPPIPPHTTTNNPIMLSPRNANNRGSFQGSGGFALGTANLTKSPNVARVSGVGLSFGSNQPVSTKQQYQQQYKQQYKQQYGNLTPIQPSNIDSTRPLKNIFPRSIYSISTKVDENLVMVDDGDQQSNYLKQGNSRFNQNYNMMSPEEQKYSHSLSQQSNTIQPNTQSFGINYNQFNTRPTDSQKLIKNNLYEPKFIVQTFKLGSKYEGYKLNGMRHGHGKFYYQDGGMYDGDWYQNKMQGYGKLYYQSGKLAYQGQWKNDQFKGKGVLHNEQPDQIFGSIDHKNFDDIGQYWIRYEGNFVDDMKNGKGILYFSNGQKFEGQFLEDAVHGYGKFYNRIGQIISGKWDNNVFVN